MALIDDYNASLNPTVQAQVSLALYAAAANVYSEVNTTPGHAARAAFATKLTTGQQSLTPLILATIAFASLTVVSPDTAVNNAVAALWSMFAGA